MGLRPAEPPSRYQEQGILHVAQSVGNTLTSPVLEIRRSPPMLDPVQTLMDLKLPQRFLDVLSPPIQAWGLTLTAERASNDYDEEFREYTLAQYETTQRILLFIPDWILDSSSRVNITVMKSLVFDFKKQSVLIIFSNLDSPARAFRRIVEELWREARQVEGHFVPQRDVEELRSQSLERQKRWVREELQLRDMSLDRSTVLSVDQLSVEDMGRLVDIIKNLPQIIDETERGWRILLQGAGLMDLPSELTLTGPSGDVTQNVLDYLKRRRRIPAKPDHEVLGLLLSHVANLEGLPPSQCDVIKNMIRRYRLVPLS